MVDIVYEPTDESTGVDLAGEVREITTTGWPTGYKYAATRYADVILEQSFGDRYADLVAALTEFHPTLTELRTSGGGRAVFTKRFDESLGDLHAKAVWGKQNITIEKAISLDGTPVRKVRTRGHEIDMFGLSSVASPVPGIAVEMEWNNKDPFYDRDLNNFQALHREGAIAIGVIVTRGPNLQELIAPTVRSKDGGLKFGQSTTHWKKLIPKVNLGGGGECPLLLIGIEPERIIGVELARQAKAALDEAAEFKKDWRNRGFEKWGDAQPQHQSLIEAANDLMPALKDVKGDGDESDE